METGQTLVLSGMNQTEPEHADGPAETEQTALLMTVTANLGRPALQASQMGSSQRR